MHVGSTPCFCIGAMLGRKNISGIPPIHPYEGGLSALPRTSAIPKRKLVVVPLPDPELLVRLLGLTQCNAAAPISLPRAWTEKRAIGWNKLLHLSADAFRVKLNRHPCLQQRPPFALGKILTVNSTSHCVGAICNDQEEKYECIKMEWPRFRTSSLGHYSWELLGRGACVQVKVTSHR